jgi:error-prone DNA polymerase
MISKGIAAEFSERVFEQIRGFGEYGFPESHAASFALIAWATAWMKCHYPEAFACSLLNAQPMGFYSVATIVDDAKRHGVEIRPVDVTRSHWHCTLEKGDTLLFASSKTSIAHKRSSKQKGECPLFSVRMGLRCVKGLSETSWERIEAARGERPFASVEDFADRTRLDEGSLMRLAEAGAFLAIDGGRRSAMWRVASTGSARAPKGSGRGRALPVKTRERLPLFAALDESETIRWDYRTTRHSPRGHPLAPLRDQLEKRRIPDARRVASMRDGARVRYAGLVICRQRPGTASGVVFMTLEDETGFVNVVVWSRVFEEHAVLIKTASFLGVSGKLQVQDGVTHLIADTFWIPPVRTRPESGGSRDFH